MIEPPPRSTSDGLSTGPCGGVAPTATPTEFEVGSTTTVRWEETIDHVGFYRIALSPPGDAAFDDNVLLDDIADRACDAPPCAYMASVTLPAEACEGCALQVIQYDGSSPAYFSCADITLVAPPEPDAGVGSADAGSLPPDAGSPPDAGGERSEDDANVGADPVADLGGGCAIGGDAGRGTGPLWLLAFAFAVLRRRAQRSPAFRARAE